MSILHEKHKFPYSMNIPVFCQQRKCEPIAHMHDGANKIGTVAIEILFKKYDLSLSKYENVHTK